MSDNTISIALLSQAGESGRHLRDALAESGTPIVYESQAADLDRDALEQSGASVVVVNLDSEVEAHLDDVYALLDDERYTVIFDESQVSSQLSGWEQARWARHLAAKILGTENADPPRPEGAEPVPDRVMPAAPSSIAVDSSTQIVLETPTEVAADAAIDEDYPAVEPEGAPTESLSATDHADLGEDDDFGDLAKLLADPDLESEEEINAQPTGLETSSGTGSEVAERHGLDLSEFDEVDEIAALEPSTTETLTGTPDAPSFDLDFDLDLDSDEEELSASPPARQESNSGDDEILGFGDLDDFADGEDIVIETVEADLDKEDPAVSARSDISESLESDQAAAGSELADLQLLDFDLSDAPTAVSPAQDSGDQAKAPVFESAFAWELENTDDDEHGKQISDADIPVEPASFGIETISASDFLAPEAEQATSDVSEASFSLELIPLEEAVAPGSNAGLGSGVETESWLDTSNKTAVSRVWVLGASIGGPEAVREFLAEIPANCPALFLLAQHMGAEFMEIMAQQLVRSTKLTVRTPSHGERVGHGDLLIVPTTHRMRVDRAGVVTLESQSSSELPNLPSIDQVLQDVADRFGAKAGAIIFSGMAEDGAEGSRYLTEIGGSVFAQDPETCVISSMVDGVIETGVVSFIGSPKALASKLLEVLNCTTKS